MIRGLLWIVRCTVWSISNINNCILGMYQSELFSISVLISLPINSYSAFRITTCVQNGHFCYFTDRCLIFAVTNVEIFDDQLDTFYESISGIHFYQLSYKLCILTVT